MGRKCAVPHCNTGYRKCNEKASLYRVPDDDFFLSKWQEAIAREDRPITPKDYVCEKHFKEDDILRRRVIKDVIEEYQRPRLKPDAIPSIFPDFPEFILKMVKKRRKMPVTDTECLAVNNPLEQNQCILEKDIKIELPEEYLESAICEPILNNEIDIKSESEEQGNHSEENEIDDKNSFEDGPKMHRCDQCDYQTKYPHNLRTHKTKHLSGEEAYMYCTLCPKFKTKWELTYRNHMRIKHNIGKQEIFKCNICAFKTKTKICLTRHVKRHHIGGLGKTTDRITLTLHKPKFDYKPKKFKCSECMYSTNSKPHVIRHIKTVHNTGDETVAAANIEKISENNCFYKCIKCPYKSKSKQWLLKHICHQSKSRNHQENCLDVFTCHKCDFKSSNEIEYLKHSDMHTNVSDGFVTEGNFSCNEENEGNVDSKSTISTVIDKENFSKQKSDDSDVKRMSEFIEVKNEIIDDELG